MMDILHDIECHWIWYESEMADAEAGNAEYEVVLESQHSMEGLALDGLESAWAHPKRDVQPLSSLHTIDAFWKSNRESTIQNTENTI